MEYVTYTDGSCDNSQPMRPGGSAYIIMQNDEIIRARNKGLIHTSNNRAELLAIVSAVCHTPENSDLHIYTDSQYCINVLKGRWKAKTNTDLIEMFHGYKRVLNTVKFHWVMGHSGDTYNEMVDDMAYSAYSDMVELYDLKKIHGKIKKKNIIKMSN